MNEGNLEASGDPSDPSDRNRGVGRHRMHGGERVSGDAPHTMYGSRSEDRIYGKGGSDVINATGRVDDHGRSILGRSRYQAPPLSPGPTRQACP